MHDPPSSLITLQGGKRKRRSTADPFLSNRIQHVYNGSGFAAPSDSDSEYSDSEASSASEEAEQDSESAAGDSDLDDFIDHDLEEGPQAADDHDGQAEQQALHD